VTELVVEFSSSAYLTDTQLSRLKRIPEVVKELMGHTSLDMTLRYAQLYEATKRQHYDQAMEQVERRRPGHRR
jgi:integrase